MNNFAECYIPIPDFSLRQIRPHTSEFFLSLAEPLKSLLQFTEKSELFHLFYLVSASSFISHLPQLVAAASRKLWTVVVEAAVAFSQSLRDHVGQEHSYLSTASAKAPLGMSPAPSWEFKNS